MKKTTLVSIAAMGLLLLASSAHARGYWRGDIWIGPGPGWWGPPLYSSPYPYYYAPPPVVIQQQPDVYIRQEPQPQPPPQNYWYFCRNPQGYYPYVKQCPDGWQKVVPSPPPAPSREEDNE